MRIHLEQYNHDWNRNFGEIRKELIASIGFLDPKIEHIGSTSVEGLSAKPIIDILVGLSNEHQLEKAISPLIGRGYVYYERYNELMPYRRFLVKHKVDPQSLLLPEIIREEHEIPVSTMEHDKRLAHIHILTFDSEHWTRHIAFRDYLRMHPGVKAEYQQLKEQLVLREWSDGNEYNGAKDGFIKAEEQRAITWYKQRKT